MSVVGIDFGNEACVVAVARRSKIEVLQNQVPTALSFFFSLSPRPPQVGNRKTWNMVGFSAEQRIIGDDAKAQQMQNAANTLLYQKRFLGKSLIERRKSRGIGAEVDTPNRN